jgi:flagellar hook-associated protein 1 FlgK
MVSDGQQVEQLQAYDSGSGQLMVRAAGSGTPLTLTGGQIQGTIEARDGGLADLRNNVNNLASLLIQEVNTIHGAGYGLGGTTGAAFFTGTNASDIQVNTDLVNDPSLLQAASVPGAAGDNGVALALAQLAQKTLPGLNNQTLSQSYSQTVTNFGQSLSSVNSQLANQQVVQNMLQQQRDSVSGVSLDEEMTNLTKFQRAFQASAKLITIVDDMLNTVVNMKQ